MKLISGAYFFATIMFMVCSQANTLNTSLSECAKIDVNASRLICFDQLTSLVTDSSDNLLGNTLVNSTIPSTKKSKTADTIQIEKPTLAPQTEDITKNEVIESFGATHLKQKVFKSNEEKTITLTIASVKKDARKKLLFTFENGQIWKQANNEYFKIKPGQQAKLTEGALGAIYLKKLSKNRSIRVKRVK